MRPLNKPTTAPNYTDGSPYREAKVDLIQSLGEYCSYCERHINDKKALQVEHIQPKSLVPNLERIWDNFLLACASCNIHKGIKNPITLGIRLPHTDNLMLDLEVDPDSALISANNPEGQAFIELVRLSDVAGTATPSDDRYIKRFETAEIAQNILEDYENGEIASKWVVRVAQTHGFFSLWYTIFQEHPEMIEELINNFEGTHPAAFDSTNNYSLVAL